MSTTFKGKKDMSSEIEQLDYEPGVWIIRLDIAPS